MTAIHPSSFVTYTAAGLGNIGSLTDYSVNGRFNFNGQRVAIKAVRVHFYGGTGAAATLTMYSHNVQYGVYRAIPFWDWPSSGLNANAYLATSDEELAHFIIESNEELVFIWVDAASPDDMHWTIKVTVLPI